MANALAPTLPTVVEKDWNSVIQFNRQTQKLFKKLVGTQVGAGSSPTFSGLTITGLTASRLLYGDSSKEIQSVANLQSWIAGTTNQINTADDGDGTITLSTPQDIHTGASPTFAGLTVDTNTIYVDNSNHRLDVGGTSLTQNSYAENLIKLAVMNSGAASVVYVQSDGYQGALDFETCRDSATGSYFRMSLARGSVDSKAVVQDNDRVLRLVGAGWSAEAEDYITCASIQMLIDGTPDSAGDASDMPGRISFWTTPEGSDTDVEHLRISQDGSINLPDLTASRLLATDASKNIVSSDLASWVTGTANQITVTDDADGTITLSTPQDIHTSATPQFARMGLGTAASSDISLKVAGTNSGASYIYALDFRPTLTSTGQNVYGQFIYPTVTTADTKWYVGLQSTCASIEWTGGSTTGQVANFYSTGPSSVTGTCSQSVAFYAGQQKKTGVTTGFGMYQSDSGDVNYFAGDVGFGLENPSEDVHALDTVRADTAFNLNGTDIITASSFKLYGPGTLGDGGTTNYAAVAADGEITLVGTARVKREFEIPAKNFSAGASGATEVNIGNYHGWQFGIGDDIITQFEIPPDWDSSTDIEVYMYWYIDEAYGAGAEVQWRAQWSATPTNSTEAIDSPTHTGTIDFGDQNIPATAKYLTVSSTGTIASSSLSAHDLVGITVDRVALDDGSNPTAEPVIVHIEIEYTSNKLGDAT